MWPISSKFASIRKGMSVQAGKVGFQAEEGTDCEVAQLRSSDGIRRYRANLTVQKTLARLPASWNSIRPLGPRAITGNGNDVAALCVWSTVEEASTQEASPQPRLNMCRQAVAPPSRRLCAADRALRRPISPARSPGTEARARPGRRSCHGTDQRPGIVSPALLPCKSGWQRERGGGESAAGILAVRPCPEAPWEVCRREGSSRRPTANPLPEASRW
jgi:hypothetical protein